MCVPVHRSLYSHQSYYRGGCGPRIQVYDSCADHSHTNSLSTCHDCLVWSLNMTHTKSYSHMSRLPTIKIRSLALPQPQGDNDSQSVPVVTFLDATPM